MDHVDRIAAQWNAERPELDVGPMQVIGRLKRIANHLSRGMGQNFDAFGLTAASFDVLATLRRSGFPYALSPGDLLKITMVTSGTMTNRIDQLVKVGLVERVKNPDDARSFLISLTDKGRSLIDRAVTEHVKVQKELVSGLSPEEQDLLNNLLIKFMGSFEGK